MTRCLRFAAIMVACSSPIGLAACHMGSTVDGETPVYWALAWDSGFYGTPKAGTNRYSNTNVAGAPDGYYVAWAGASGGSSFSNVSDCSSFSDVLLSRSYGWTPATTMPRPHADDYYWAIRDGEGFDEITDISDVQVGDVIALLYPSGSANTGHVAWIVDAPSAFSGLPDEAGLSQYVVTVVDSTDGFHDGSNGPSSSADDRYLGPLADGSQCSTDEDCQALYGANAVCNTTTLISYSVCSLMGVGRGQMRLYADATGAIAGHTWSPNPYSTFYPRPDPMPTTSAVFTGEDIVVGRYSR